MAARVPRAEHPKRTRFAASGDLRGSDIVTATSQVAYDEPIHARWLVRKKSEMPKRGKLLDWTMFALASLSYPTLPVPVCLGLPRYQSPVQITATYTTLLLLTGTGRTISPPPHYQ